MRENAARIPRGFFMGLLWRTEQMNSADEGERHAMMKREASIQTGFFKRVMIEE